MSGTLRALLTEYRCPVVDRLERIYEAGNPTLDRDRFLAITVPQHRNRYVQCIFQEARSKLLCEASSGFYFSKRTEPRTFRLPPSSIDALARLGFSTDDSAGNFQRMIDVGSRPNFNAMADLILKALHDAYGARAVSRLEINAPFAPRPSSTCIPLS
jgi:hypothetical protein